MLRRPLPRDTHPELLLAGIETLVQQGAMTVHGAVHARADWQPVIAGEHAMLLQAARNAYRSAGLASPAVAELSGRIANHPDCAAVLRLLERNGELVQLEPGRYLDREALRSGIAAARHALGDRSDLGPGDFRAVWGLTRKHLIPLLEYLDRTGVTERTGDVRRLTNG